MADQGPLSDRPVLVFPIGELARTLPGVGPGDMDAESKALAAELRGALGTDLDVAFDEETYLDGLGAEALAYVVDVWGWISRAADVATLAAMGAALFQYLRGYSQRLHAAGMDEIDTCKAMPAIGAPVMRIVGAHHAMDSDSERARRLETWTVQPLLPQLAGDSTAFHAQQLYLVTGIGQLDAFVGVFTAYGTPREMMWIDVYDIRHVGS